MIVSRRQFASHDLRIAAIAAFLLLATLGGAWVAWPLFVVPGVLWLVLVAYMANRWPLGTLVGSTLMVLADPVLLRTALPDSISFDPIGASEPMLAVTGAVITVNAIRHGTFWPALRDPVLPLVALFALVACVSAVVNGIPAQTAVLGIVMTIDAVAIYFLARMIRISDRHAEVAVGTLVAVALVASIIGILQVVLHPDLFGFASFAGRFGEGGRITSFLGNPNMVAAVIGFTMPFPLFAARRLERKRDRWLAFAALTIFSVALLLTFSRGAWLAVLLGVIVSVILIDWRALGVLAAGLALAWVVTIVMPRNLLVPAESMQLYFPAGGAPSLIDSTLDRLDEVYERRDLRMRFIREGLPIVADNIWLGVGPGRYGGAAASIIPSPVYAEYGTSLYGFRTVHNFWLHLFGEVGVIGGAVFVVTIVGLWFRFFRAARQSVDPWRFVLLAGTATAVVVVSLNNMTEMIYEGNFPAFLVWLVAGIASTFAPPVRILGSRSKSELPSASGDLVRPDAVQPG